VGVDVRFDHSPSRPSRWRRIGRATLVWIEPGENPSGLIYGTITVGALLAAEAPRRETFPRLTGAVALTLALYWLAHAYSTAAGERYEQDVRWSVRRMAGTLAHEAALLRGAAAPLAALLLAWAAGADTTTATTAGLWTSAAALVAFELAHGLRNHLRPAALVAEVFIGLVLGAVVIALHVVLH
jgi:hypothetical protein